MSKIDVARERFTGQLEELRAKAAQYDHAINIRKMTISELMEFIRSLKEIRKDLARKNQSTKRIFELYKKFVEDYNMHVGVLMNLKRMLADAREEAFLLELLLKGDNVGGKV